MKNKLVNLSQSIPAKQKEKVTTVAVNSDLHFLVKEKLKKEGKSFHDLVDVAMKLYLNDK